MLLFDSTKRFFEAWIAQLANYALVIILVASVANLMLHAVSQPLQIAYSEGASVTGADALRVSVFCGFVVLILAQILPMASGLASGIALSSGNIISGMVRRGLGTSGRFGRGVFDAASGAYSPSTASRLDPLSRKAGQQLGYQNGAGGECRLAQDQSRSHSADRSRVPEAQMQTAHKYPREESHASTLSVAILDVFGRSSDGP